MEEEIKNNPLKQLFNSANSVLVLLPPDPSQDLLSAGLSLYQSLKSVGKTSQIGCGSSSVNFPSLVGAEEIVESVGNKNLQITFDYLESHLEKVDYEASPDGKFSLVIKPKEGSPVPEASHVKFSYSGANADLVIVFGINSLEELGKLYADEKRFLDTAKIVSINTIGQEAAFTPNMFHLANTTFCELTCLLLQRIEIVPPLDAANNLLNTIYQNTDKLTSPKVSADTFGNISYLMKNGAKLPFQTTPFSLLNQPPVKPAFFDPPTDRFPTPQDLVENVPQEWKSPKVFSADQVDPATSQS